MEVEEKLNNSGGIGKCVPKGWRRERTQEGVEGRREEHKWRRYKREDYSKASHTNRE